MIYKENKPKRKPSFTEQEVGNNLQKSKADEFEKYLRSQSLDFWDPLFNTISVQITPAKE